MKRLRTTFGWLALCLAAAATTAATAADKVRVGEGPFITGGAFLVAREKGYFKGTSKNSELRDFLRI
jgi:NitT/TauT family transport system substrate-binding protein